MNMKHKNRKYARVSAALAVFVLMALLLLTSACRGGDAPAGDQNGTIASTDGATDTVATPTDTDADTDTDTDGREDAGAESGSKPSDTESVDTEGSVGDPDTPKETEGATQPPVTQDPEVQGPVPSVTLFEDYQAMNGTQQLAFFQSFSDPEAFFEWYNAAVADYQARNPGVEIGPGGIIPTP
jgi:hypothetical protein